MGYIAGDQFEEVSTFEVSTAPLAAFDFVDITQRYLNGLPTIEVRATAKAESYNWEYANGNLRGDDVDLHFFEKGMHDVRLTVTNELGCSSTTQQSVYVEEDYNLMAMDAFVPNGINTTFMPYALTERNTPFTMVIIDPNDGHVMYETSDASQGWDGTDQQTGSPAPIDKSYIWKVTLQNPEHGESSIYSGTVLMLSK
jgi:PKD repeat protein